MDRCPHTYFSTEFRGGQHAVKRRLVNLFAPVKRRGALPLACLALSAVLVGSLVACNADPAPSGDASGVPQAVYDYAMSEAGEQGKAVGLSLAASYDYILDQGVLEVYEATLGTKDFDPDSTPLAGGMSIDDEGYLFSGWLDLLLFQVDGGAYTPICHTTMVDGTVEEAAGNALSGVGVSTGDASLSAAGSKLIARRLLTDADAAFAPLIGAAPTEGEPYTDGTGVVWHRLSGYEQGDPYLRVDDQVFGPLIQAFGREKAASLMQTYVYVPDSVFLEKDGGLWVRADAADLVDWHCTGDISTLTLAPSADDRLDFTMEGTDDGQPVTWQFSVQWSDSRGGGQFTQYYKLSIPFYDPTPTDGKPQAIVDAVRAEIDATAAALEAENSATEILDSRVDSLDIVRSLQDIVQGHTLEVWSFDYRLLPADFHTVTLSGSMGVDRDGWLVDLYSMGVPCVIALRDEKWSYTVLGLGLRDDFGASEIHYRAGEVIAGGTARNGLALTAEGWEGFLPAILELAAQALEHYPAPGFDYSRFSQAIQDQLSGGPPEDPAVLGAALTAPGGSMLGSLEIGADQVSFLAGDLPCTMAWNGQTWQFTRIGPLG